MTETCTDIPTGIAGKRTFGKALPRHYAYTGIKKPTPPDQTSQTCHSGSDALRKVHPEIDDRADQGISAQVEPVG